MRASKYENTSVIWFATNSQGEHPVLFVPIMFISLVSIMMLILYYFYKFQEAQEVLAGYIDDLKMLKYRKEKGMKLVVERNQ